MRDEEVERGLGVNAVISLSIRLSLSSMRSIASPGAAVVTPAMVDLPPWCLFTCLLSELFTQSILFVAQKLHGLAPSHFVFRLLHVSQADPELSLRAACVEKTPREWSVTTL